MIFTSFNSCVFFFLFEFGYSNKVYKVVIRIFENVTYLDYQKFLFLNTINNYSSNTNKENAAEVTSRAASHKTNVFTSWTKMGWTIWYQVYFFTQICISHSSSFRNELLASDKSSNQGKIRVVNRPGLRRLRVSPTKVSDVHFLQDKKHSLFMFLYVY